ncbi:hypothetical protein GCM10020295_32570 [Streptomyces cinereospinus]
MLRFEYTAGSAKRAARVTNAFAEAYLADRQDRTRAMVRRMTSGLEQQIALLTRRIDAKSDDAASAAALRDQVGALQKRASDLRSYDTSGGDVVRRAEPPARPSGPGPAWLLGLGLAGGLLLGLLLAWLRSALEPRARSVGEVQAALGAPVLGILPGPDADDADLLVVGRAGGSRAEAYRTLAFRLRAAEGRTASGTAAGATAPGTLLVVAPKEDRDAEAAAVNLAAAFAESGDEVLLVDATASASGLPARLPLPAGAALPAGAPEGGAVVDAGTAGRFVLLPDGRAPAVPTDRRPPW